MLFNYSKSHSIFFNMLLVFNNIILVSYFLFSKITTDYRVISFVTRWDVSAHCSLRETSDICSISLKSKKQEVKRYLICIGKLINTLPLSLKEINPLHTSAAHFGKLLTDFATSTTLFLTHKKNNVGEEAIKKKTHIYATESSSLHRNSFKC